MTDDFIYDEMTLPEPEFKQEYQPKMAMKKMVKKKIPKMAMSTQVVCNCPECLSAKEEGEMKSELAFVMYKPDAFERGLVGELMNLVDSKGLKLVYAKTLKITEKQLQQHYSHHVGKNFWLPLVKYITGGNTLACVYKGQEANAAIRQLIGNSKHPTESPPGSIRGKYATAFPQNLIHGSDNWDAANHEMHIFLTPDEIVQMKKIAATV